MRRFRWLNADEIPPAYDLRRCGWVMAGESAFAFDESNIPVLADTGTLDRHAWITLLAGKVPHRPAQVLLLGVAEASERARLLSLGFGDAMGAHPALVEVDARAQRLAFREEVMPRRLCHGEVTLDLFSRDAFVEGRAAGLHPREFALLWWLMERPGMIARKDELLARVWRLRHVPETNSLAVHVARLRAKLRALGIGALVRTSPCGGYFIEPVTAYDRVSSGMAAHAVSRHPADPAANREHTR